MSEQTPTSTDDLRGVEPSMEDILASIRKIISEDKPVAMESPEDVMPVDLVSAAAPLSTEGALSNFGQGVTDLTSDAVLDVADLDVASADIDFGGAEGDSVDLNIDDVLASLGENQAEAVDSFTSEDLQIPEIPADASEDFSLDSLKPATEASDVGDDDILSFLDSGVAEPTEMIEDIVDVPESGFVEKIETVSSEAPVTLEDLKPQTLVADDDVEMDALLDDILLSPEDAVEDITEDIVEDTVEDFAEEEILEDLAGGEMADEEDMLPDAEQSDLDLVKSLMAELSDDPGSLDSDGLDSDIIEMDSDLEDLLDVADVAEADIDDIADEVVGDVDIVPDLSAEAEEEDILGDILNMSLEDELQAQPDDLALEDLMADDLDLDADLDLDDIGLSEMTSFEEVAAAEQVNIEENIFEDAESDIPSLAEIASAAEADALAVETSAAPMPVAAAGLTAAGSAGLAAFTAKAAQSETDTDIAEGDASDIEITTETSPQSLPTQETPMPVKAVKTDTILDEVTETATAGAFAELNQVVEDKAVFNESGPRIGDLVQDALRPMLKEWLDANLKGIVERAVTKEVKRISKGN